jgi:hypothetical protein
MEQRSRNREASKRIETETLRDRKMGECRKANEELTEKFWDRKMGNRRVACTRRGCDARAVF